MFLLNIMGILVFCGKHFCLINFDTFLNRTSVFVVCSLEQVLGKLCVSLKMGQLQITPTKEFVIVFLCYWPSPTEMRV